MNINIKSYGNATEPQAAKIHAAVMLWQRAWDTIEFRAKVLNFRGGPNDVGFAQNSKPNHLVLETIMMGNPIEVYYAVNQVPNGSETAATNTSSGLTTIQARWIDSCTIYELADTLAHEFTHTPQGGGFTHSYLCSRWMPWTLSRPYSVPYAIGQITYDLAMRLPLKDPNAEPNTVPVTV